MKYLILCVLLSTPAYAIENGSANADYYNQINRDRQIEDRQRDDERRMEEIQREAQRQQEQEQKRYDSLTPVERLYDAR